MVACLLDPSLKLTVRQRATGQCYGAYCEMITGASSDFMREAVDGGRSGGGGYNERVFEMRAMVSVAQTSLATVPAIRYAPAKPRGGGRIGRHWRVKARFLADRVCIDGWSLTAIAVARFWTAQHKDKGGAYRTKVPDRQRKHLAQALRDVLDVIDAAWQDGGYAAPFAFGGIDVE